MRFLLCPRIVACILAAFLPGLAAGADSPATAGVSDFCFLQISDPHINPQPVGAPGPRPTDRSADELSWFCAEAGKPQVLEPAGITTPVPAFVIATGDLTEYGVIHKTWENVEHFLKPLTMPLFVTPGNHDNTWTGMQHIMRRRHGGDHYAFDRFGCHFVSINTATPQEPVPSIEQRTLTWLRNDLDKVEPDTPVFIFCHHPLSSGEFAKPYEQLRFLEVIQDHNVVLLMMGHGHSARHERWGPLDSVMGGETWRQNTGYNIISVINGTLRVVYRYRDAARGMAVVLEKPVRPSPAPRIESITVLQRGSPRGEPVVSSARLRLAVTLNGDRPTGIKASLDDDQKRSAELQPADNRGSGPDGALYTGEIPVLGTTPGAHFVRVVADYTGFQRDRAARVWIARRRDSLDIGIVRADAGAKAAPLLNGQAAIVATTAGTILVADAFQQLGADMTQPAPDVLFDAGVEILHAPVLVDGVICFSAAEKGVHAITPDGKLKWQREVGAVTYGTPAVAGDRVYVGDLEGHVHAIDRQTGRLLWSRRHADFSIEQPLTLHDGVLYFGAWDGQLYAVSAEDGSLRWKQPGPAAYRSDAKYKSRYYAPADCPPVVIGERLFVADRAYCLGSYSLAGEYLGEIADGVSAIGLSEDGRAFYTRGNPDGLARYDAEGRQVWSNPVPLGRFPIPPTEKAGKVYVCSNLGRLTAHDAADGQLLWEYQVTPQLHVMAPVAADARGNVYVVGMDGVIARIHSTK